MLRLFTSTLTFFFFSMTSFAALEISIKGSSKQEVCIGDTLWLGSTVIQGTPTSYLWSSSDASFLQKDSSTTGALVTASTLIILESSDGVDIHRDTLCVTLNWLPVVRVKDLDFCQEDDTLWLGQELVISPGQLNLGTSKWECIGCARSTWDKLYSNTGGPFARHFLDLRKENYQVFKSGSRSLNLKFTFTNAYGCSNTAEPTVTVYSPQIISEDSSVISSASVSFDLDILFKLRSNNGSWTIEDVPTQSALSAAFTGSKIDVGSIPYFYRDNRFFRYRLVYSLTDSKGCSNRKEHSFRIDDLFKAQIDGAPLDRGYGKNPYLFCETEPLFGLRTKGPYTGGQWFAPGRGAIILDSLNARDVDKAKIVQLVYKTGFGLTGSDSVPLLIEEIPEVRILTEDTTLLAKSATIEVEAYLNHSSGLVWLPLSGGSVDDATATKVKFTDSLKGDTAEVKLLYVYTNPGNVCPFVDDMFRMTLKPGLGADIVELEPRSWIYPNPSHGILKFEGILEFELLLYDFQGRNLEIDLEQGQFTLTSGMYTALFRSRHSNEIYYQRLIVQ